MKNIPKLQNGKTTVQQPDTIRTPHAKQLNYVRTGLSRQEQIDLQNLIRK